MIGNLILALGVAFCAGAPLVNDAELRSVHPLNSIPNNGGAGAYNAYFTSNVTGNDMYCYSSTYADIESYENASGDIASYMYRFRISDGSLVDRITLQEAAFNTYNFFELSGCYDFAGAYANDSYFIMVVDQTDENGIVCRFFVPLSSTVSSIEFSLNTDMSGVSWAGIGYGDVNDYNLNHIGAFNGNQWYLLSSISPLLSNGSYSSGSYSTYASKFCDYFFYFRRSTPNALSVAEFGNILLCGDTNFDYDAGYNVGYGNGYNAGAGDGYANGYAAGLATASSGNASIKTLFGVLADTPIRFLKQMFSFELFGMNVATIILSCLTAIVIFTIIKKVWK